MKHFITAMAVVGLAAVSFAASSAAKPDQIHLAAQNGSGETGTATLLQSGPNVVVIVRVSDREDKQPAHIHKGSCAKLDPKPLYPLTTIVNGRSETTVPNVTLAKIMAGGYAINVHKSTDDVKTYVACGDLTAAK